MVGATLVRPGDAVVGDRDGVVVVAAEAVEAVAAAARERLRKEQDVIARLRNGETTLAIYELPAVERMSADLLERLRALDACAVSDALERHGLPRRSSGSSRSGRPMAIAGRARHGPARSRPRASRPPATSAPLRWTLPERAT